MNPDGRLLLIQILLLDSFKILVELYYECSLQNGDHRTQKAAYLEGTRLADLVYSLKVIGRYLHARFLHYAYKAR
jgi:hypothetical protein